MALLIHSFVLCPPGYSSVTRVFDWLAITDGILFPVFSCAVFRWVLLCKCCTALAHSNSVRQTHLFDEPGSFWDSCHQNASVGGRISNKNSTHTKVGETKCVVNVDSECNCIPYSCKINFSHYSSSLYCQLANLISSLSVDRTRPHVLSLKG